MPGSKMIMISVFCAAFYTMAAQDTDTIPTTDNNSGDVPVAQHEWPVWVIPNDSGVAEHDTVTPPVKHVVDSSLLVKVRVNGFRVQLYSGGNSRKDKMKAIDMAYTAKMYFEEMTVYTQFISPHWVCRIGDYTTHEDAMHMLHEVRETGKFPEAVIVKCKVNSWQ